MVDQLASDYAGQPAVFVEQYAPQPIGDRYSRFWAAFGGGTAYYPLVIIDSGHQYTSGTVDYYGTWKAMLDSELARQPQASIQAQYVREADHINISGRLTNQSGQVLSASTNSAEIAAIVYEDAHVGVTNRYVRAAPSTYISPALADGASMAFTLQTPTLIGVDWTKLHVFVLADYRPTGNTGPYDMLQAAFATSATVTVQPDSLTFLVDPASPTASPQQLTVGGASDLIWTASSLTPWLSIQPLTGDATVKPQVSVSAALLSAGWQEGIVTIEGTVGGTSVGKHDTTVRANYGPLEHVHLPMLMR